MHIYLTFAFSKKGYWILIANQYSPRWFEHFHSAISDERTRHEVAFINAQAPLPEFRVIADICCGTGRHARALAAVGYEVTGVERDAMAVQTARQLGGGPSYICADVREPLLSSGTYDAIIVMSQSFGYFDDDTNAEVLGRLSHALRNNGIIVLDLWNPNFFHEYQGERAIKLSHATIVETKHVSANRLLVRLDYQDGNADEFDWQLFTPAQMTKLADTAGLDLIVSCTDFDDSKAPHIDNPKIQFVLRKREGDGAVRPSR